jgi:hypothetical protein
MNDVLTRHPTPVNQLLLHYPRRAATCTVVTLEWANEDWRRCRLCPRANCVVTDRGTCTRVLPGVFTGEAATYYRHPDAQAGK